MRGRRGCGKRSGRRPPPPGGGAPRAHARAQARTRTRAHTCGARWHSGKRRGKGGMGGAGGSRHLQTGESALAVGRQGPMARARAHASASATAAGRRIRSTNQRARPRARFDWARKAHPAAAAGTLEARANRPPPTRRAGPGRADAGAERCRRVRTCGAPPSPSPPSSHRLSTRGGAELGPTRLRPQARLEAGPARRRAAPSPPTALRLRRSQPPRRYGLRRRCL